MEERENGLPWNNGLTAEQQREKDEVLSTMEKINKAVWRASSGAAGIGALGIIGTMLLFVFSEQRLSFYLSQMIYGLLFIAFAVGIFRRSRVAIILALALYALDAVYLIVESGLFGFGMWIRVSFFALLLPGTREIFRFHKFEKQHIATHDADVLAFIQTKPEMTTLRRAVYVAIAVIAVLIMVIAIIVA